MKLFETLLIASSLNGLAFSASFEAVDTCESFKLAHIAVSKKISDDSSVVLEKKDARLASHRLLVKSILGAINLKAEDLSKELEKISIIAQESATMAPTRFSSIELEQFRHGLVIKNSELRDNTKKVEEFQYKLLAQDEKAMALSVKLIWIMKSTRQPSTRADVLSLRYTLIDKMTTLCSEANVILTETGALLTQSNIKAYGYFCGLNKVDELKLYVTEYAKYVIQISDVIKGHITEYINVSMSKSEDSFIINIKAMSARIKNNTTNLGSDELIQTIDSYLENASAVSIDATLDNVGRILGFEFSSKIPKEKKFEKIQEKLNRLFEI